MNIDKRPYAQATFPGPAHREQAARGWERWRDALARLDGESAPSGGEPGHAEAALDAVFGNSPFLTRCILAEPAFALRVLDDPESAYDRALDDLAATAPSASESELVRALRIARRRVALTTALADIGGIWSGRVVTERLSRFAERAVGLAVASELAALHRGGDIVLPDPEDPARNSGLVVLGMGKLGAGELNYSSDIDLVVLFDDERIESPAPDRLQKSFVRLSRNLLRLLDEPTKDGYVFRTDLRLRPDPASTPLAVSVHAAEIYYESAGQNWERAAMIKARPIGGDVVAGQAFLDYLTPFIWRKNLDFAAIQDIHSIKRQIHAHRGGGHIAVKGHNIKLGRGGIREIEFFAQTQQLIWGGRDPSIRVRPTCDALDALAAAGHVDTTVADELKEAYWFLRRIEHRLQMIDDHQTHALPKDDEGLAALATFLGYPSAGAFADELIERMRTVERHYARLFEEAPTLSQPGNLVFTGTDDDPDTIRTLEKLGYDDPRSVAAVIRGWHHGRYRATRSTRAREMLTELVPTLLEAFAGTANPKSALVRFDEFLRGLPAGVQLFSMLHANPRLTGLLAEIMGTAPRLATHLSRNAGLFDAVLSPGFFDPPEDGDAAIEAIEGLLSRARDFQDVLDITRRWTHDEQFRIGVQILRNVIDGDSAGPALADIADANIRAIAPRVEDDFAEQHGRFADGGMAIVAMGKLGSREMTVTSDLDLIFIYDVPPDADASDGAKPLSPSHYFARLSQRVLNALTAPTAEGPLYDVDMRLRPSGRKGPIASSFDGFAAYQTESAWTWEHMALTRARVVTGPPALGDRITAAIRDILTRPRDPDALVADVADMRRRIDKEFGTKSIWDTKYVRGGMIDAEFVAQYLQLRHAAAHPGILAANTTRAIDNVGRAGLIDANDAQALIEGSRLWHRIQGLLRLTVERDFDPATVPEGLRIALAQAGGAEDIASLERKLRETASTVHALFRALVEEPAAQIAKSTKNGEKT